MFLCPRRLKVNKGEKYNHSKLLHASTQAAAGTCTHLASYSVEVLLSLQAQDWLFEQSANSVHCLTGNLHAHVFPTMLRIPALDHSRRFVCSVSPPCVLLSLDLSLETFVDGRFEFHSKKLLQFFLVLEPKIFFVLEKNPIRCDFLLFRLVGCDSVLLLVMYITQNNKSTSWGRVL